MDATTLLKAQNRSGGRTMKIYIAGAITNKPDYKEQFAAAENWLKERGHTVLNPCKADGFTYKEYIDMGLAELSKCDAIYMLKGWQESSGAKLEHEYARIVGLRILEETKK